MVGDNYLQDKETKKMRELIEKLNSATKAYDEGHPIMSDQEWDNLYFELLAVEREAGFTLSESPTQIISYQVVNQLDKITHNHKMLSLDKTKELSEVESFLGLNMFVAMCKMDGLTCSLHYNNGILIGAETRGNGIIGEDILHNAKVIPSIPKYISYLDELIIDGEIICSYRDFEKFSQEYKNPRNFAAGSIRLLDSKECESRSLKFVAWDVIKGLDNHISHSTKDKDNNLVNDERFWFESYHNDYLSDKLQDLAKLGFTIVPWVANSFDAFDNDKSINLQEIVDIIKNKATEFSYPIDGVVFKFDNIEYGKSLGETAHHFKNAIAYKFYDETYQTKILDVEWSMGRTGVLTPVAILEPIEIDGTQVTRANLHNIGIMQNELKIANKGQIVEVYKANMIIPQIARAYPHGVGSLIKEPRYCPICEGITDIIDNNGVQILVCTNPECSGKLINKLDHFCGKKGLDIKGISKATLEKLMDWGWITCIEDIFKLKEHEKEWASKQGFGIKSVTKILDAIEASRSCTVERFISALGIPLIGMTVAKDLAQICNYSYEGFRTLIDEKYNFAKLPNFGEAKCYSLLEFDYSEADRIYENYIYTLPGDELPGYKTAGETEKPLENLTFAITGKLKSFKNREELVSIIESHGGKVIGAVSSKTNYLVNNDVNSASAKNVTAKKLGIPIITEEELIAMF